MDRADVAGAGDAHAGLPQLARVGLTFVTEYIQRIMMRSRVVLVDLPEGRHATTLSFRLEFTECVVDLRPKGRPLSQMLHFGCDKVMLQKR